MEPMLDFHDFQAFQAYLQALNGSTSKKDFLSRVIHANPLIAKILRYTYDEEKQFYVAKKVLSKIQEHADTLPFSVKSPNTDTVDGLWDTTIQPLLDRLVSRELSGNAAIHELALVYKRLKCDHRSPFLDILSKDLRAGVSSKTINAAAGYPLIPEFEVQLANTYDPKKRYTNPTEYWWASPKLDGIRAVYKAGVHKLYTRQGKELLGFDRILEDCRELCQKLKFTFLDGELYSPAFDFQEQQGAVVAKKRNEKQQVIINSMYFNVFAALPAIDATEMVKKLTMAENIYPTIAIVPQRRVKDTPQAIMELARAFVNVGFEGIMLRDPEVAYSWKRDNYLLKFKFFQEMDLTVVGYFEGNGKYAGKLGGLTCEGELEHPSGIGIISITTEVGSGFTDKQRIEFWKNRFNLIGKTVELQYQNITDRADPETKQYSLRFPTFLKFKEDR